MTAPAIDDLLLGESAVMTRVRSLVARLAPTRLPVLIQGPTGAGKELVAQALHAASGRPGRFVALNVCAIPDAMVEDTLFGHVRGAFTGAAADHKGYLREADGGTVFLDEIGALSLDGQAKLLRVSETRIFRPVGAAADVQSDFRLVAATNVAMASLVRAGRFRGDLAHRISAAVVTVPPLRDHQEDVPQLARHFARAAGRALSREVDLSVAACDLLAARDWSGNIRELRNVVQAAVALDDGPLLGTDAIRAALALGEPPAMGRDQGFAGRRLLALLEANAWNTTLVARELGVHRGTVYRRIQALGIQLPPVLGRAASARAFASVRANSPGFVANERESQQPLDQQAT